MHYTKTKSILSPGNTMNLYRGCTHGCIYCDSRGKCYRMTHCFEDIEVKENAIELLEAALRAYQGRALYDGALPEDTLLPLCAKYGLLL